MCVRVHVCVHVFVLETKVNVHKLKCAKVFRRFVLKKSTLYSERSVAETDNYCGPSKEVVIHVIMSQRSASFEKSSV